MSALNKGINVGEIQQFRDMAREDPTQADRSPSLVAHWVGGSRSRVEYEDVVTYMGGDGELNPMQMLLASFAACDVDLIAMHASLLGLKIESLAVECSSHFSVESYLGIEDKQGSGYGAVTSTVHIRLPGATPEQIDYLRERCEKSSPVGDSLARAIEFELEFEADTKG